MCAQLSRRRARIFKLIGRAQVSLIEAPKNCPVCHVAMQATKIENGLPLPALRFDDNNRAIAKESRIVMPTEIAIIVTGIVLIFAVFAAALRVPDAAYFNEPGWKQ
jgi:hypothetical protein